MKAKREGAAHKFTYKFWFVVEDGLSVEKAGAQSRNSDERERKRDRKREETLRTRNKE